MRYLIELNKRSNLKVIWRNVSVIAKAFAAVVDYASSLGLEAAKEHISGFSNEKGLQKLLKEYIEKQFSCNESLTINEDIDFQGLFDYIVNNLLDDVTSALFDPDPNVRMRMKENIISKAFSNSCVKHEDSKKEVETIIRQCIDVLYNFYEAQIDRKDYIIGAKIVDAISQKIEQVEKKLSPGFKAVGNSLISIDKAVSLSKDGKFQEIEKELQEMLKRISLEHPLYPYYGYNCRNGVIGSNPLTSESVTKYPPRLKLKVQLRSDNHFYNPFDYAYRHQIPVVMDVLEAEQYLGNVRDPIQNDAPNYINSTIVASPPKFPAAIPCSIKIRDKTYYEYVLFRTQEIEDDGTCVISNIEQDEAICFEFRFNPAESKIFDYKAIIKHSNNHELLKYIQFVYDLSKEKELHIYVLSEKKDLLFGNVNNITLNTGFSNIEAELDFLKRICEIEDYFNVEIVIPEEIKQEDFDVVCLLSDLICNKEIRSTWEELSITNVVDKQLRDSIGVWKDDEYSCVIVSNCNAVIFGTDIIYKVMTTYKSVKIADLEKLKQKLNDLDNGDSVKIKFKSGDDKTIISTLQIPKEMDTQ